MFETLLSEILDFGVKKKKKPNRLAKSEDVDVKTGRDGMNKKTM
jgi:hypothetical protein